MKKFMLIGILQTTRHHQGRFTEEARECCGGGLPHALQHSPFSSFFPCKQSILMKTSKSEIISKSKGMVCRGSQAQSQSQAGGFKKSTTISAILSPPAAAPELGGIPEHERSKRPRPSTEEEYAALCLVMLARGHTEGPHHHQHISLPIPKQQQQLEYKCTICGKALGSYHALGGHKNGRRVKVHKELSTFGSL